MSSAFQNSSPSSVSMHSTSSGFSPNPDSRMPNGELSAVNSENGQSDDDSETNDNPVRKKTSVKLKKIDPTPISKKRNRAIPDDETPDPKKTASGAPKKGAFSIAAMMGKYLEFQQGQADMRQTPTPAPASYEALTGSACNQNHQSGLLAYSGDSRYSEGVRTDVHIRKCKYFLCDKHG